MSINVLHVTDVHAVAEPGGHAYGQDVDRNLEQVIDAALARTGHLDVAVVTGDVADDASLAAYRRVRRAVGAAADIVRWVPGNHDDVERMGEVDADALAPATVGAWRFVPLDSARQGRNPGEVGDAELRRFRTSLDADATRHTAVLVHHPPRPPCPHPDCQTIDRQPLLDVLDDHPPLRLVLSGHLHRSFQLSRGLVSWIGGPSTCMQIDHPDHTPTTEPPAANLMELGEDGSVLVSTVQAADGHGD